MWYFLNCGQYQDLFFNLISLNVRDLLCLLIARSKQTARKSSGGKVPLRALAGKRAGTPVLASRARLRGLSKRLAATALAPLPFPSRHSPSPESHRASVEEAPLSAPRARGCSGFHETDLQVQSRAIAALREASEGCLAGLLEDNTLGALHAKHKKSQRICSWPAASMESAPSLIDE